MNSKPTDPKAYYKVAIAVPFLDDISMQLQEKFVQHKITISKLACFLPSMCSKDDVSFNDSDAGELNIYKNIDTGTIATEFSLWKKKWSQEDSASRPTTALEALNECQSQLFPNIFYLLKIYATLPVTTCTAERSFSTLKRLKTFLRNSTGEERLNGLALMSVHRRFDLDTEEVMNDFAAKKSRRLNFILE